MTLVTDLLHLNLLNIIISIYIINVYYLQKNLESTSIRILPHKQNTSGMFVGVLTRVEYLEQAIKREEEETKKKWEEGTFDCDSAFVCFCRI